MWRFGIKAWNPRYLFIVEDLDSIYNLEWIIILKMSYDNGKNSLIKYLNQIKSIKLSVF